MTTPEMRRDRRRGLRSADDGPPGFNYRCILTVDLRVMFMAVNKNACTSLKWMMADVCGEDLARFRPYLRPCVSFEDAIHSRRRWATPRVLDLDDEQRADLEPPSGWFVFAVTRDPRIRLFSAWQNKLLMDNPAYAQYRSEPWYPRHPATTDTIVDDFRRFVHMLTDGEDHELFRTDGHFMPQTKMLMSDVFEYSRIYDLTEIGDLVDDLAIHLDQQAWGGDLRLSRFNDTPLRPLEALFGDDVRERIEDLYRADFDEFGHRWASVPSFGASEWSEYELREIELRASFGRRLTDLLDRANRLRRRLQSAEQENEKLRAGAHPRLH